MTAPVMNLYDSKSQTLRAFAPIKAGQVGMYVCGPTVQGAPHVGHLRSALVYDILRRWLAAKGLEVTMVRNVTDIDDKVLEKAVESGQDWWALAYRFEQEFNSAYRALGIAAPTYEPRATGHIPEQIALIERLVEAGYAYRAEDGSADVYFAASKWAAYGELTNQRIDDMVDDGEAALRGKRDSRDFTRWKAAKDGEPETATWQTPFGAGRPGWHLECSAMSTRYLGSNFDIHGGGLDLRFPHHENELAQSRAAGDAFANYWLHNGLVNVGGQKMSKSLGNSVFAADLFAGSRPIAARYFLGSAHYRSVLDLHDGALAEAETAMARIEGFVARATRKTAAPAFATASSAYALLPEAFVAAMDEDMNLPAALAVLHEQVRAGNAALDAGSDAADQLAAVVAMLEVLGLNPLAATWSGTAGSSADSALESLVDSLIVQRNEARANKDFSRSDSIRDQLKAAGIQLEDAADATNWSIS